MVGIVSQMNNMTNFSLSMVTCACPLFYIMDWNE